MRFTKSFMALAMLMLPILTAKGQQTNYSKEFMSNVLKYDRYTVGKKVAIDPATGIISITFDRFWRNDAAPSQETWGISATDNLGAEYRSRSDYSAPTYQGMWTRVTIKGNYSFVVHNEATKLTQLELTSLWCGRTPGTHDYVTWKNIPIERLPYDTIFPAWSAEAYASNSYTDKGTKVIPYTGRTECIDNIGVYIPFRLIGLVGNSQTGMVTLILSAHALNGGKHAITIESLSAFDDDGNPYEKNYGYKTETLPLVYGIDREIRCIAFQVPVNTSSFQRIEINCKAGSFDHIKYRCDDIRIQWVKPTE